MNTAKGWSVMLSRGLVNNTTAKINVITSVNLLYKKGKESTIMAIG